MTLVPKKIFYAWFGGKKPTMVNMCIQNWREKMPDYEIIEINETSPYFDFQKTYNTCEWFRTVYDRKMWAFVADYARCKVLYEYGGIYLDTDITICRNLSFLDVSGFCCGEEKKGLINAAVFICKPKYQLLKDMVNFYNNEIFDSPLYTIPDIMSYLIAKNKYKNLKVYPREYFYPYYPFEPYYEDFTPKCITPETYTVHWWNASWVSAENYTFLTTKHLQNTRNIKQYSVCNTVSYKLFSFLPLYSKKQKNGRIAYSWFGMPLFKIRKMADNFTTKYYMFGLLILQLRKQQ